MTRSLPHPGRAALLILAAAALNLVPLDVSIEARFFLGPFVYMPLVLVLPQPWGILAAAAAMADTAVTLGHPFALLIMTGEAVWLGLARRWSRRSLIFHDAMFWMVVGLPALVGLCYGVAQWPVDLVVVVAAKRLFNQLAAVAGAVFLLRHTRLAAWLADHPIPHPRMRDVVFHSVFTLAIIPLAAVAIGVSVLMRAYCEREDREVLAATGLRLSQQIDLFLDAHESAVTGLANTLSRGGGDATIMLEELRRSHPEFTTMFVTDATGRITHVSRAGDDRMNFTTVADREYFRQARDLDRTFVSGVLRGRVFGRDILVPIGAPLHDAQGRFAGVVAASLEVHSFASLMAGYRLTGEVSAILADASGRVISANARAGLPPLAALRHYPEGILLSGDAGDQPALIDRFEEASNRQVRFSAMITRAEKSGMIVITQRPQLTGLDGSMWVLWLFGGVGAAILGVAAWVARLTRRRAAEPLEYFATSASHQAAMRTVEPIANRFDDAPHEVAIIFRAFNLLADQLQGTYAMLRRNNAELDRQVSERTAEADAARHQAEVASKLKTEFLAMTGHEIRTPLNAILGLTDTLIDSTTDLEACGRLRTIRSSGARLLTVLNDLLDLSKVEAGKLELQIAPVDLGQLCHEVCALFLARAQERNLRLDLEFGPVAPLWIEGDGPRLQQVLINLVGNALAYTHVGRVGVSVEQLWATATETTLRLAVRDSGPGISQEQQARLFQPYVQLADTGPHPGTGLGLAISRRLVGLMGGELRVSSEPGYGAEFFFTLVLRRSAPPVPAPDSLPAPEPAAFALRVLAADDNLANQEVLRSALAGRCARLEIVGSAVEALDRLAREQFDVALLDLGMPDADGFSVARGVRSWRDNEASCACRLIAISAHRREEVFARCTEAGFDDYVEKPIDRRALFNALNASVVLTEGAV